MPSVFISCKTVLNPACRRSISISSVVGDTSEMVGDTSDMVGDTSDMVDDTYKEIGGRTGILVIKSLHISWHMLLLVLPITNYIK